jgi:ankyrin repeat protein
MVKFLFAHGADVNAKNQNGSTPLQMAARHKDIAELLRQHGGHE